MELELHVEKLELILLHLALVFLLSEGFRLVEVIETDAFFWHECREAVFRQDLQDEQEKGGGNLETNPGLSISRSAREIASRRVGGDARKTPLLRHTQAHRLER